MKKCALAAAGFLTLFVTLTQAQSGSSKSWGGALWVWDQPDAHQSVQSNDPRYLRRTFDLSAKVLKAELWITADNQYVAYVNGQKIGADGEWNTVERFNVAKHLVQGKNVLAIKATNQGGPAGVIARLHIRTADKKDRFIVTDQQMKITQNAPKDWLSAAFNDSSWFQAVVLGDVGIGPWNLGSGPVKGGVAAYTGKGRNYGSNTVDPSIKGRLSAADQKKHFIVPKDFEIELVAADPLIINPITMTIDDKGRIIVSESHTYRFGPPGSPIKPFANPVIRLDPLPDGKGFKRTLVADGFADPVMGIAVKGDKLWLTANNYLYQYDINEASAKPQAAKGIAINRKTILVDKNKAWNPFGMFVLEWGPDGKLYMSVGDHNIDIQGPDGKITARGRSGMVMRMNPDGTKMERLDQGLRVPYSFEFDPFGQLWQLSNGEGNPDRFIRVIDGVDYHCYTRGNVDNNWLAGNNPLAPPCEDDHGGAHTQFMRYYGAAYPKEYQGNLFACNWGRHGFSGPNRGIFRFILDDRNNVVKKETLVTCADPHFRPSHIILDQDGSLLIADWYGRDDESDMTGRIWRLKYVGTDKPRIDKNEKDPLLALGSPDHRLREWAVESFLRKGQLDKAENQDTLTKPLYSYAAKAKEALGAANALWVLLRINTPASKQAIANGAENPDWRVRRLAMNLLRHYKIEGAEAVARKLLKDADPAVRLEAAIALSDFDGSSKAVSSILDKSVASDVHLRYEAAWHLAKHADNEAITKLLTSDDANIRLAGLIAIDVACYENFPTKKVALEALAKALENPGKLDQQLLLTVAQLDGDASIVPALEKLIGRDDVPLSTTAKAILVLKAKAGGLSKNLGAAAGKRLIEAVEKGAVKIASPADQLMLFEFLEADGPTPFALKQIGGQLRSNQPALRQAAHILARKFGTKSAPLADQLWPVVLSPKTKFDEALEQLSTISRIEAPRNKKNWEKLLDHPNPLVRTEVVRWWRNFKDDPHMVEVMVHWAPQLLKQDPGLKDDLGSVFLHLKQPEQLKALNLPEAEKDKSVLTKHALATLATMTPGERKQRAALGLQVFERSACTKCHTTATQTTPLAPSLKGIAGQKLEYMVESVLFPSKIIKTGFETVTVTTTDGKVYSGLVKEEGKFLRILNLDKETRIAAADVESKTVARVSIMPEGQEAQLSRREFVDLIAYLATLK